jgi:5-methylcytosine-specific restriction enzyme subunit McrC
LNLARLFLDGGVLQMVAGDLSSFAFVFDMNQLFESFVAAFIRRHASEILPEELQACDYLVQSRGESRHLATRETKDVFKTKPDIVFRQANLFPLILDTKYKRLNSADLRLGVDQSDFYQMHAYAHRYNCSHIILLYPQTAETLEPLCASFKLADCDKIIRAATVNLQINLARKSDRQLLVNELKGLITKGTS